MRFVQSACLTSATALIIVLLSESPIAEDRRGSLVIAIVAQKGDYVVVGAESRNLDKSLDPLDDLGCKVIQLGSDTLFFETGNSVIRVNHGADWDARSVARAVFRKSTHPNARALSIAWGNRAIVWFYPQAQTDLKSIADRPDGGIVTGGFIDFEPGNSPSVETQTIYYSEKDHALSRRPSDHPPELGQLEVSGAARELVGEFFAGNTQRAVRAFGPIGSLRIIAVDPYTDADLTRKAIRFAEDNSTGIDHASLGGPIDIAILRRDRTIEWVSRKANCYDEDEKPAPRPKP